MNELIIFANYAVDINLRLLDTKSRPIPDSISPPLSRNHPRQQPRQYFFIDLKPRETIFRLKNGNTTSIRIHVKKSLSLTELILYIALPFTDWIKTFWIIIIVMWCVVGTDSVLGGCKRVPKSFKLTSKSSSHKHHANINTHSLPERLSEWVSFQVRTPPPPGHSKTSYGWGRHGV